MTQLERSCLLQKEKDCVTAKEKLSGGVSNLVNDEINQQVWQGEMASKAYEFASRNQKNKDVEAAEKGVGQPLPPIQRDTSFKQGGWIASWSQQRRAKQLDGGSSVTKLRLKVSGK